MKPATEEFLYFLLWTAETLVRPTWRNVVGPDSFEAWAYRQGLHRRLAELERLKLIDAQAPKAGGERLVRLTAAGREFALAGVDPAQQWERTWDGRWRLAIFDVPQHQAGQRSRLRRALRNRRFGYLQNSVWLSPDPLSDIQLQLKGTSPNVEGLVFFEGRPGGGESDQDLVMGAWNFPDIFKHYETWNRIADSAPQIRPGATPSAATIRTWAERERSAWSQIAASDPFLPAPLLPANYPGRTAWARRVRLLTSLGQALARVTTPLGGSPR